MALRKTEILNKFSRLAYSTDEYLSEELDLLNFITLEDFQSCYATKSKFIRKIYKSALIKNFKDLIEGVESPDKIIIDYSVLNWFEIKEDYANQSGLIDGIDFIKKEHGSASFNYFQGDDSSYKLFDEYKYTKGSYICKFSWNGIKKIRDYMVSLSIDNNYPTYMKPAHALDFEKVYKKTKELYAYNRKCYLDALQSVSASTEVNKIASESDLVKRNKKHINTDTVNLIILNLRNGTRKYIVSQDITEKLNEVIESFDYEFTISFVKEVTQNTKDDIVVIKSINKKDIASYLV